jgi:hypothetical protein
VFELRTLGADREILGIFDRFGRFDGGAIVWRRRYCACRISESSVFGRMREKRKATCLNDKTDVLCFLNVNWLNMLLEILRCDRSYRLRVRSTRQHHFDSTRNCHNHRDRCGNSLPINQIRNLYFLSRFAAIKSEQVK